MLKNKGIIISGRKQSGKSSCGQYLCQYIAAKKGLDLSDSLDKHIKLYNFADKLKQFCIEVFGMTYAQVNGTDKDKNSLTKFRWENLPTNPKNKTGFVTCREMMEWYGTDIIRKIDQSLWIDSIKLSIEKDNPDLWVICDSRFSQELEAFNGPQVCKIRLLRNPYNSQSEAETALDNYPFEEQGVEIVDNRNMTLEEKNEAVLEILKRRGFVQ